MKYTVMLRQRPDGHYSAVAPAIPDCRVEGRTRHEALERLKISLEDWLLGIEVTSLEVSTPSTAPGVPKNPWLETAGLFADDGTLELMLQEIYDERAAERLVA